MKRILLILIPLFTCLLTNAQTVAYGTESGLYSTAAVKESKVVALSSTLFVATYAITSSGAVYVRAGTLSSGTITWGTAVSVGIYYPVNITPLSSTSFFLTYIAGGYLTGRVGTVSTRTITLGSGTTTPDLIGVFGVASVAVLSSTKVLVATTLSGGGVGVYIGTISTRTLTWGNYNYTSSISTSFIGPSIATINSTTAVLAAAEVNSNSVQACVVDISTNSVVFNTFYNFSNFLTLNSNGGYQLTGNEIVNISSLSSTSFILGYSYYLSNVLGVSNNINCVVITVNGTALSLASDITTIYSRPDVSNVIQYFNITPLSASNFIVLYNDVSTSSPRFSISNISGSTISSNYYTLITGNTVETEFTSNYYIYPSSSTTFIATYGKASYYQYVNSATITFTSGGKKRYGITISKWNGISPSKINGI